MAEAPILCTLNPADLTLRREALLTELVSQAADHEALPDGHRLRFVPADHTLAAIARIVDAERRCCRFLRFQVTVEPNAGFISLDLTGPPGTREFLASLLES